MAKIKKTMVNRQSKKEINSDCNNKTGRIPKNPTGFIDFVKLKILFDNEGLIVCLASHAN